MATDHATDHGPRPVRRSHHVGHVRWHHNAHVQGQRHAFDAHSQSVGLKPSDNMNVSWRLEAATDVSTGLK